MVEVTRDDFAEFIMNNDCVGRPVVTNSGDLAAMQFCDDCDTLLAQSVYRNGNARYFVVA